MRGWRLVPVAVAALAAAAAVTLVAVAVNAATSGTAGWYRIVERYPLWWTAGATAAAAMTALAVWRVQAWYERRSAELVPAVQRPEAWVVDRPAELNQVVAALLREGGGTVGITTAVQGAGGFGKTTIAKMVRADPRVLRRFRSRVYWVTVGRDTGKEALAELVNGLITQLEPDRPVTFTDARQAGDRLAAVLAKGPRRLLVLDDVWTEEQLAAFPVAGRCARLVTTRVPSLTASTGMPVRVDRMSAAQARAMLVAGLPPLQPTVVAGLLAETGQWPLLLRLVNKVLAGQATLYPDITTAAKELLSRFRTGGTLHVDELTAATGQHLDVADPVQREKAVRATIQAGTGLLGPGECDRLAELAVFAEDEAIPVPLIIALWQTTGVLDDLRARSLCVRLADLALLTPGPGGGVVCMHDVVRDYLCEQLGDARLKRLHQILLDNFAETLPSTVSPDGRGTMTAWWELPEQARYLREHLIEHMLGAGRAGDAEQTSGDLRWVDARLQGSGPAGPSADLSLIGTPRAERLRRMLVQTAHLLAPTDPPYSLTDILYSRVSHDPDWGPQAKTLDASRNLATLANMWPPPDLPGLELRRTLTGHKGWVQTVAISPDSTWLATASYDGTVRIWEPDTGLRRAILTSHTHGVIAVAIAPDGTWLATTSEGRSMRIWDAVTGRQRAELGRRTRKVTAVAIPPDGSWLTAAILDDPTVRIWDAATGRQRAALKGHMQGVTAVAIAPDGTWLATASYDRTVRIWDAVTWQLRASFVAYATSMAIAPDSTWLATVSRDGSVRIWDAITWQLRASFVAYATSMAIAPDGTWLATASSDGLVCIWDASTWRQRIALHGHARHITALAIAPDGTWLATSGWTDQTVRVWDPVTGLQRAALTSADHTGGVMAVAIASDGSWLVTAGQDGSVRIWDPPAGPPRLFATGRIRHTSLVDFAPDGSWLATASWDDQAVRIWDAVTGLQRATLNGHTGGVTALAIASDGSWLATADRSGSVRTWDAATLQQSARLSGPDRRGITALAIAPDGSWLAAASRDGPAWLWDNVTGQQRLLLAKPTRPATAVVIAPDGSWLATGNQDLSIRIWDADTGRQRTALTGHTGRIQAIAITPDGSRLASAQWNGSLCVWDPSTPKPIALMRVNQPLQGCAWSPSGQSLAAVGYAGVYHFVFKHQIPVVEHQ